jgi:SagB-type dehydrogenase family enzyme
VENENFVLHYHETTKHHLRQYAAGPEALDWDDQPEPFRWFDNAVQIPLPLTADHITTRYIDLYQPDSVQPQPLTLENVAALFELSMGLSAWKQYGETKWALRCNPSSGNLHPTEAYAVFADDALFDAGVYHYLSRDHLLEQRCCLKESSSQTEGSFLIGLSSIHWREAWKYGERAFRYCQLDVGHAIAAIGYAATTLGWHVTVQHDWSDAEIAALLGLDRDEDFGKAEREHADVMLLVSTSSKVKAPDKETLLNKAANGTWQGKANRLSGKHLYDWPIIDQVTAAALKNEAETVQPGATPDYPAPLSLESELTAAQLIRQRRSGQAFDGATAISAAAFFRMLDMTLPRPQLPPWDSNPTAAQLNLILFVHRVEGIRPGLYALIRNSAAAEAFKTSLGRTEFQWQPVEGCPAHIPLYNLVHANGQKLAATLSCHQGIAAQGCFSLGMLADIGSADLDHHPWHYRTLFWEAGMVGQVLYLEAEAAGVRGTGIGCYFDDAVHELLGIGDKQWQSLYHFTVGGPLVDARLQTIAPYAHLDR